MFGDNGHGIIVILSGDTGHGIVTIFGDTGHGIVIIFGDTGHGIVIIFVTCMKKSNSAFILMSMVVAGSAGESY
jgi:hypothetical protein